MTRTRMEISLWTSLLITQVVLAAAYFPASDLMKCSYGERGSLTATCVNANSSYFKMTPYRFDQLDETLVCQNCSLKSIESGTFDLSGNHIKKLILKRSQIEMIKQKAFVGLIFLEDLDLSFNSIRSIYPGTFSGIKKVKKIDLSHNAISILSEDGFAELIYLEELDIRFNAIITISGKAFNGLRSLRVLDFQQNNINDLSNIFYNLSSLQKLNIMENKLVRLTGTEFSNLTGLLELDLSHNQLTSLVIEIPPNNNTLRKLRLNNNNIDSLNIKFLNGLHSLETLDISFNSIKEVAKTTLQSLYNLRTLDLSFNQIRDFQTGTYTGLPLLELLNCSHNQINHVVVTGVLSLSNVYALDLSNNRINDLDYVGLISRLPKLSYLRLENNSLPCYLEDEMNTYFNEDNFKFVLYDENDRYSLKCLDVPVKKTLKVVDEVLTQIQPATSRVSGGEVTLIVLICIVFVCIGFLFYLQYRTYQDLSLTSPRRSASSVVLVSSDMEDRHGDNGLRE